MDRIVCLVGESGSGKSTIAELLEKEGYNYIQSYTNRPKRTENEKGHLFVESEGIFAKKEPLNLEELPYGTIAYTFFDGYHYWATKEQYNKLGTSIYVVDASGVNELKKNVKDAEVLAIYLRVDFVVRAKRMYVRKYDININELDEKFVVTDEDIIRRLKHDKEAFRIVPCNYAVDCNRKIENVFKDVNAIIQSL